MIVDVTCVEPVRRKESAALCQIRLGLCAQAAEPSMVVPVRIMMGTRSVIQWIIAGVRKGRA